MFSVLWVQFEDGAVLQSVDDCLLHCIPLFFFQLICSLKDLITTDFSLMAIFLFRDNKTKITSRRRWRQCI